MIFTKKKNITHAQWNIVMLRGSQVRAHLGATRGFQEKIERTTGQ